MDKEENTSLGNSIEATSTDPNHEKQIASVENGEDTPFQADSNNPAKFNFESSARITSIQRSSTVGRSSSPPPPSSVQENRSNFIQRRKSTPSWTISREVKYIKKDRRKKGVEQMLVIFQNDKNDIGRWIDVSELNCPQLIEEYWERKKQMKESNLNNESSEKQSSSKNTGTRTIKEIVGMIPSQEHKYIYAVIFNDAAAQEYVLWKEMRKYYSKQLLKFYESHIDQDNFIIAPPSSISSILPEIQQISHHQSQPQIIQPQNQKHHHHQQQSHPHQQQQQQQQILTEVNNSTQTEETQKQDAANEEEKIEDETENKNEVNNSIPIFLMNDQSSISHNLSIPKIQGLQSQVQLQRITSTPSAKEQTRSSQPQILSQLIQQNSMIMNRK